MATTAGSGCRSRFTTVSAKCFCPHCGNFLTKKAYLAHKKLYYDDDTQQWIKKRDADSDTEFLLDDVDFQFESDSTSSDDIPPIVDFSNGDMIEDALMDEMDHEVDGATNATEELEVWKEDEKEIDILVEGSPSDARAVQSDVTVNALTSWLVIALLRLKALYYISDAAIECLLKFLKAFFKVLGSFCDVVQGIAAQFPQSVYGLQHFFNCNENFQKLVVCPVCNSVYSIDKCVERPGVSKVCTCQEFARARRCGSNLLKTVELAGGKKILYPVKVFRYQSIVESLKTLLAQPNFSTLCEQWRSNRDPNFLKDIYDGRIWKEFLNVAGKPFLSAPYNLAFSLNIDWFQPYKLREYSVGVIYLTILNLPRSVRYKRQYTIIVGVIPGPTEPKRDINSFLLPLVKELTLLWEGVLMKINGVAALQMVQCALLCVACDLPAGKKACGFLGHTALYGCSRCLKEFTGSVGDKNYSGFKREEWKPRSNEDHRSAVQCIQKSANKTQRNSLESTNGCRYSALLMLPYFDPVRMLIIDPLHNLFLGSGKYIVKKLWIENGLITSKELKAMQDCVDSMCVPTDVGRIPGKVLTGFSGFTGDQFKNWINLYSIPALHGVIEGQHLECWRHLVLACRLMCKETITFQDITVIDALLLRFCCHVERLYGTRVVTPNMHMHCHYKEILLDYGPAHSFWLFAYERFNGILGNQPNNNKCIESQLMRRFTQDNNALDLNTPALFCTDFSDLKLCKQSMLAAESLQGSDISLPPKCTRGVLCESEHEHMEKLLSKLHPSLIFDINFVYLKYSYLQLGQKMYRSCIDKGFRHCVAIAEWKQELFGSEPTPRTQQFNTNLRPVKIHFFVKISFSIGENISNILVAAVSWYTPHPACDKLGKPAEVWCNSVFEVSAPCLYH